VSIGQFRPEKNHKLQIEALDLLLSEHPELRNGTNATSNTTTSTRSSSSSLSSITSKTIKLKLIGSCRNDADRGRVKELRDMVERLQLQDYVEFCIDPPYKELQQSMTLSSMGIHTMREEHFGIGIVEMMAAGLLVVAHDSGGPKTDIIQTSNDLVSGAGMGTSSNTSSSTSATGPTGFRATTAKQYADAIYMGLCGLTKSEQDSMRYRAQMAATRFSDDAFDSRLTQQIFPILFCTGSAN
jgi:alpha-1,2-mannosyltransferase